MAAAGRHLPRKTELRPHRNHQHHGAGGLGPLERYETPDPVRSNAMNVRFHGVRPRTDGAGMASIGRGSTRPRGLPGHGVYPATRSTGHAIYRHGVYPVKWSTGHGLPGTG
jgi:hypothetical protein